MPAFLCREKRFCCWRVSWLIPNTNCSFRGSLWWGPLPPRWATTLGLRLATTADVRFWNATGTPSGFKTRRWRVEKNLFARYGAVTIFFARFVFGMRIIAGPLAGVLRMPWRRFAVFNFLGAGVWVTIISGAGYLFGQHLGRLERDIRRFDVVAAILVLRGIGASVVAQPSQALVAEHLQSNLCGAADSR